MKLLVYLISLIHLVVFIGILMSLIAIWLIEPWYICIPLSAFVANLTVNHCALTTLENKLRTKAKMSVMFGGWFKYYMKIPHKRK